MGINTRNSTSGDSHMCISLGYVAQGQKALLEVEKDDMQLQENQRQQNLEFLQMQNATMKANAKAAESSAHADALSDYMDAGNQGAQAAGDAVNVGYNIKKGSDLNKNLEESQTKLKNAEEFEKTFNTIKPAKSVISDEEKNNLTPEKQLRLQQLKENQGELKLQSGDNELLEHLKADDSVRQKITKHINAVKADANTEQNTEVTQFQAKMQTSGMIFNMAKQAASAGFSGAKGWIADNLKGKAEATRVLAQTSGQNIDAALSQGMQTAATYESQAAQLNRAREALASNGQG